MPGWQIPQKAPNNWQSRSSQRSIECRRYANTKPKLETLRPRIDPKSIGRFCCHYAKLGNALALYQLLLPNGPSGVTQGLSPFAPVIPLCSVTRVDSVSPHTGNFSIESRAANLRR